MSIFEQNGGTYIDISGYYIPCIFTEKTTPIGRWGRSRKQYLREHHPVLFSTMLLDGTLYPHLAEIDHSARVRLEHIIPALAAKRGINEQLKAEEPFTWVKEMNLIQTEAEEAIFNELITCSRIEGGVLW